MKSKSTLNIFNLWGLRKYHQKNQESDSQYSQSNKSSVRFGLKDEHSQVDPYGESYNDEDDQSGFPCSDDGSRDNEDDDDREDSDADMVQPI